MNYLRYGEQNFPPFRTQRLYSQNGEWYFDTREGKQIGPYRDNQAIKQALAIFVAQRLVDRDSSIFNSTDFHPGAQDGIEHLVEELFGYYQNRKQNGQTAAMVWANNRLRELLRNRENASHRTDRMAVLRYALNQEH